MAGKISALYVYPIKSCSGVKVRKAMATAAGLQHDRQWMIAHKATGKMLTQRTHPKMTQIKCDLSEDSLSLTLDDRTFYVSFHLKGREMDSVVWKDTVKSYIQDISGLNQALSVFLSADVHLVKFADTRRISADKAPKNTVVQYADKYPFTIADMADLGQLNAYFSAQGLDPIGIERFRANIVLEDVYADVGNRYEHFFIATTPQGKIQGHFCEPCCRCSIPDIDPKTGRKTDHQVKRSLKSYRNTTKDWFSTYSTLDIEGQNLLSVGDAVLF